MATSGYVQNGVKRRKRRTKRRNGAARTTVAAKKSNPAKRRSISLSSAMAVIKRNGKKVVSKSANPKRKRSKRRRNGTGVVVVRRPNGIFGNSKHDVQQVSSLLGGMAATKLISKVVTPFAAPWLARVGMGQYAEIVTDGVVAIVVVPFIAGKVSRNADVRKMARLGALAVVALDAVDQFAPSSIQALNPFNGGGSPIVIGANGQAGIGPGTVMKLINNTSATPGEKAAVAGVVQQLAETGAAVPNPGGASGGMNRNQRMPMSLQ